MSKEKLHKVSVGADVNNVPDGWFRIIPATTVEIMDAHPKCGECKWYRDGQFGSYCGYFARAVLLRVDEKDYCRHWEKEQ